MDSRAEDAARLDSAEEMAMVKCEEAYEAYGKQEETMM